MIGTKRRVGNNVNGGTGVCAGVIASGRGGCQATQTVIKQSYGYGVRPLGRGGGKATPAVNLRNPCGGLVRVGTVNVGTMSRMVWRWRMCLRGGGWISVACTRRDGKVVVRSCWRIG